jgi:hypothetical protein
MAKKSILSSRNKISDRLGNGVFTPLQVRNNYPMFAAPREPPL